MQFNRIAKKEFIDLSSAFERQLYTRKYNISVLIRFEMAHTCCNTHQNSYISAAHLTR